MQKTQSTHASNPNSPGASLAAATQRIWERNQRYIPGGLFSLNRHIEPVRVFERGKGAYLWDIEGNRFIDYHAAFAPYFLGHGDPEVDGAVIDVIKSGASLFGAGTTAWEGELAELIVESVPTLDQVQVTNTGSEATSYAIRLARAHTGRDGVLLVQGGYNGWEDDVAFNLMDPAEAQTTRDDGRGLNLRPLSTGIPATVKANTYVIQFNDLAAAEQVLRDGDIAVLILEPILQNVGIVKPEPGYLEGLRELCDRYGTVLVFDEVKTGFRHALGGYQSLCGVRPDLSTFGKAIANGYPLGVIGGKREVMAHAADPDPKKRVLIAGTYNGHPVPVAAAIATLRKLRGRTDEIYGHTDALGAQMEEGLQRIFAGASYPVTIVRQRSAFVVYFMDHAPKDWLDIARHHDMERDKAYRNRLIENGVFHFPTPTKQGSISFAHTAADISKTLEVTERIVGEMG
ncbi:MAG TPA: aspartate aminotransferase family protein [Trueperaceae bacterium]|nr:aspartate aminotransferase family protein [Trueperaceae bacterium]